VDEFMAVVQAAKARSREVPRYLCTLAHEFDRLGVKFGSHDDADANTRERFSMIGARVCEFPTGKAAAAAAKSWDDPVLMGAPNVVRGGSQSGNIAATALIRAGLCTALVSDYHYPTLHKAAFRLADAGVMDLATAWGLISTAPAQIMGLADRGSIASGKRADLTIINRRSRMIEGTMAGGRWSHLAGELAQRLSDAPRRHSLAAE
jgi:alpha-D-ribose 1-methylphosphonate 5-triphosphate diphosphatase